MIEPLRVGIAVGCMAAALGLLAASSAFAQQVREAFDLNLQRKAMRELAGPEALCQEAKEQRKCEYATSRYEVYVSGNNYGLFANLHLKELDGPDVEAAIVRLLAIPPMFGFDGTATRECLKNAYEMSDARHTTGNVTLENKQFNLICRVNAPSSLIFDLSTKIPAPKSTF